MIELKVCDPENLIEIKVSAAANYVWTADRVVKACIDSGIRVLYDFTDNDALEDILRTIGIGYKKPSGMAVVVALANSQEYNVGYLVNS